MQKTFGEKVSSVERLFKFNTPKKNKISHNIYRNICNLKGDYMNTNNKPDTTENYIELANSVLIKAIEDYETSVDYIVKHSSSSINEDKYFECVKYMNEIELFFNSNFATLYSTNNTSPKYLFEKYKKLNNDKIQIAKSFISNYKPRNKKKKKKKGC